MGAEMSNDWGYGEISEDDMFSLSVAPRKDLARHTVIIFDWDDTLCCSSAMNGTGRGGGVPSEDLEALERVVESVLRTAMSLGETLIVTNGQARWVQESSRRWLPGLAPLLEDIEAVSARSLYQRDYPKDPLMWKWATFEQLLTRDRQFQPVPGLNLVSIGDQMVEHHAANHAVRVVGGMSLVKTVKFKEGPSVAELLGQLCKVERLLASLVASRESLNWHFQRRVRPFEPSSPQSRLDAASRASAWRCLDGASEKKARSRGCYADTNSMQAIWSLMS